MGKHSRYSPSKLKRILGCPGYLNKIAGLPRQPSGVHAMRGSIAHFLAERCIHRGTDAIEYVDHWGWYLSGSRASDGKRVISIQKTPPTGNPEDFDLLTQIDVDMCSAVQVYVDEIRRVRSLVYAVGQANYLVEQRLDLSWLIDGMFGTADHIAWLPLDTLYVDDYKNGHGVVEVDDPQFEAYALGALGEHNERMIETIDIGVTQPNAVHCDGPVRRLRMSAEELYAWGYDVLKPGIEKTKDPDAPCIPGSWCTWCEAKQAGTCDEYRQQTANVMFSAGVPAAAAGIVLPDPKSMTGEQLREAIRFADLLKEWISEVRSEGFDRLDKNHIDPPPGYKLAPGRVSRKFKDLDKVVGMLTLHQSIPFDELYTKPEVLSVAQVEKVVKRHKFDPKILLKDHIEIIPGNRILVEEKDPREKLQSRADQMFGE